MDINEFYKKFYEIYTPILDFHNNSIPLCAAETVISNFVKMPLMSFVQEKYILGGIMEYSKTNFVGSNNLYKIYYMLSDICKTIFKCNYADGRTLSGVNTISTLLMSLFESGDTIYISDEEYGGHSSMPIICKRLGINIIKMPYDFQNMDFCYDIINIDLRSGRIKGILVSLSDILFQPDLTKLELSSNTILIYDATQVLGLIAANKITNFFNIFPDDYPLIIAGSTHKTLPGPTNGLILTNSKKISEQIDLKINPDYLRNVQMHQILSLIFCLVEFDLYGKDYINRVVENAENLAGSLSKAGFELVNLNGAFTSTHQLFLKLPLEITNKFYLDCQLYNITLNERYRKIYSGSGIRIGTQQISRYDWGKNEIEKITHILHMIYSDCLLNVHTHYKGIHEEIKVLIKCKNIKYTVSQENFNNFLKLFKQ